MMFRIRRYQVVPGKTEAFNDFFLTTETDESFMTSTVPIASTELSHLET